MILMKNYQKNYYIIKAQNNIWIDLTKELSYYSKNIKRIISKITTEIKISSKIKVSSFLNDLVLFIYMNDHGEKKTI